MFHPEPRAIKKTPFVKEGRGEKILAFNTLKCCIFACFYKGLKPSANIILSLWGVFLHLGLTQSPHPPSALFCSSFYFFSNIHSMYIHTRHQTVITQHITSNHTFGSLIPGIYLATLPISLYILSFNFWSSSNFHGNSSEHWSHAVKDGPKHKTENKVWQEAPRAERASENRASTSETR